jgi:hypothetical protein
MSARHSAAEDCSLELPQRASARPSRQGSRRSPSLPRARRRPHHLDLPHLRRHGVRAAAQHALLDTRWASDCADLNRTDLTAKRARATPGRRRKGRHPQIRPSAAWLGHHDSMARDVPVQYFQSIITVLLAVAGALLFQVRFFELTHSERTKEVDPFLRLVMIVVITATLFASLEAMREGWGRLAAALVTTGLALSLLRVLPPLTRDLTSDLKTQQRERVDAGRVPHRDPADAVDGSEHVSSRISRAIDPVASAHSRRAASTWRRGSPPSRQRRRRPGRMQADSARHGVHIPSTPSAWFSQPLHAVTGVSRPLGVVTGRPPSTCR